MKKQLILTIVFLCIASFGFSQNNILGGGFESWKKVVKKRPNQVDSIRYFEPDSSWFSTLNILDTLTTPSGITAYRCDTVHGGAYSARVVTGQINLSPLLITIPGVIGTIKLRWATESAILGMRYPYGDSLPKAFSGFYKSYPLNGDSSAAVILLTKRNAVSHHRDTIAYNRLVFHGTIPDFTEFNTPITYFNTTEKPDSLTVLLLSCAGFNASDFMNSKGQVGSMAIFDDVSLSGVNGFPILLMPSVNIKLFPNPASELMHVELSKDVDNGYFEIYDGNGKYLRSFPVNGKSATADVKGLNAGAYYYKLSRDGKNLNSGTFIVAQ